MKQQKLQLASKIENIVLVEKLIDEVCAKYHVNEDYYGNILVALTEAVNNAIQHGNKANPNKNIELTYTAEPECLIFTVKDEGTGFDYQSLPDPTNPENIEKLTGRGVFLMRHLADRVDFEDEGRLVKLEFDLKRKPEE